MDRSNNTALLIGEALVSATILTAGAFGIERGTRYLHAHGDAIPLVISILIVTTGAWMLYHTTLDLAEADP